MEKFNRTIKRGLEIMEILKDNNPLSCKEIAAILKMPLSSTFDIMKTLYSSGYLEFADERSKLYRIGPKAFEIGASYIQQRDFLPIARPYAEQLMHLSNSTSFIVTVYNDQIIYLDKIEAPTSVHTSAVLGSRMDMYCSGLGKSILACYTDEEVTRIFNKTKVVAYSEFTITDLHVLLENLKSIRERGYSIDDREGNKDVYCIAAPIKNFDDKPIGAISVAMMYSFRTDDLTKKLGEAVSKSAMEISKKMGYHNGALYI